MTPVCLSTTPSPACPPSRAASSAAAWRRGPRATPPSATPVTGPAPVSRTWRGSSVTPANPDISRQIHNLVNCIPRPRLFKYPLSVVQVSAGNPAGCTACWCSLRTTDCHAAAGWSATSLQAGFSRGPEDWRVGRPGPGLSRPASFNAYKKQVRGVAILIEICKDSPFADHVGRGRG